MADQVVKLIVGAGQASPSPPVGPALGSKGVKSMDFCKVRLLALDPNSPTNTWPPPAQQPCSMSLVFAQGGIGSAMPW